MDLWSVFYLLFLRIDHVIQRVVIISNFEFKIKNTGADESAYSIKQNNI